MLPSVECQHCIQRIRGKATYLLRWSKQVGDQVVAVWVPTCAACAAPYLDLAPGLVTPIPNPQEDPSC